MNLQDRALLVNLTIESWGTTKQDKEANRAVAAAKHSKEAATRVSKRLAPEDALKGRQIQGRGSPQIRPLRHPTME